MLQTIAYVLVLTAVLLLLIEAARKRAAKHRRVPAHRLTWLEDTRRAIGIQANIEARWH